MNTIKSKTLGILILMLLTGGVAHAEINTVYLCSLKVTATSDSRVFAGLRRTLVDIKDQEVRVPLIAGKDSESVPLEAFPGSEEVIRSALGKGQFYLIKAYWKSLGNRRVPEINVGIYANDKYNRVSQVSGASGDAGAYAQLKSQAAASGLDVDFSCRNKDYSDI